MNWTPIDRLALKINFTPVARINAEIDSLQSRLMGKSALVEDCRFYVRWGEPDPTGVNQPFWLISVELRGPLADPQVTAMQRVLERLVFGRDGGTLWTTFRPRHFDFLLPKLRPPRDLFLAGGYRSITNNVYVEDRPISLAELRACHRVLAFLLVVDFDLLEAVCKPDSSTDSSSGA